MNFIDLSSARYSTRSYAIRYTVLHTSQGYDSRSWLSDSPGSQVSANYLVREEGIYRIVPEGYAAWHAGIIVGTPTTPLYDGVNPNQESIGIEMEGFAEGQVSPGIIALTAALLDDIDARNGYLPTVNHSELSEDRTDPGAANRAAVEAARGGGGADLDAEGVKQVIREMLSSEEGANLVKQEILRAPNGYGPALQQFLDATYVRKDGK